MPVEDLAAVGEQLKHLDLAAVGGHHDVSVFTQELHIQHLIIVAHKLREGGRAFISSESVTAITRLRCRGLSKELNGASANILQHIRDKEAKELINYSE